MPAKSLPNNKNVLKELEKNISPILVVNNSALKPYVELFDYAPENIYQQPLGSLVGFFEIKEYGEDSAYIVNFLTSVLKKEYYINPKRPVTESLDSALHKVNLALSELAKHGNVEWLGKLHAAICVLEKNNAHFSVAGNAKIFLFRNTILTDISEDLASDSLEPHPLKTFVNVSSGRLEKDDRMLITTEDIFHILPENDLKKNFQRFEGEKFVQFLKTALSNQMEMIAAVVVGMTEPEPTPTKVKDGAAIKTLSTENVFSQTAFAKAKPAEETQILKEESAETSQEPASTYTDEKTGHIYIQGEAGEIPEVSQTQLYLETAKEKLAEGWYLAKAASRRRAVLLKKNLAKKLEARRQEKLRQAELQAAEEKRLEEERVLLEIKREEQEREEQEKERQRISQEQEAVKQKTHILVEEIKTEPKQETAALVEIEKPKKNSIKPYSLRNDGELSFQEKLQLAIKEQQKEQQKSQTINLKKEHSRVEAIEESEEEIEENANTDEDLPVKISLEETEPKLILIARKAEHMLRNFGKRLFASKKNLAPHFSKIKLLFSTFSAKQKKIVLLGLFLVFVVPFFIARYANRPKPRTITELQNEKPQPEMKLLDEKNLSANPPKQILLSNSDIKQVIITENGPVAITKNSLKILASGSAKDYPLPTDDGFALSASYMSDLSLILILTDQNKIVSFSPISLKYSENNIALPESTTNFMGTYLTYLYVLDPKANQIYRYPRADGGFGEKTNWLKSAANFTGVSDMTIDDSIYTIENNELNKYFKGQKQDITLTAAQTPVHFDKIFTNLDASSLWVLDKPNARLLQYSKANGSITKQYALDDLKNATSFSVDEKNKTAYAVTSSGLISIALQ